MPGAVTDLTQPLTVLASCLAVLLALPRFLEVLPMSLTCHVRWKECVHLHDASGRMRKCTTAAILLCVPFICTGAAFRLHPLCTAFGDSPAMILLSTALIVIAFFMVHHLFGTICIFLSGVNSSKRRALEIAMSSDNPFFMVCSALMTATAAISLLLSVNQYIVTNILLWELGLSYTVCFIRKFQILASHRSFFAAFLYLCALEILPCGALILAAIL